VCLSVIMLIAPRELVRKVNAWLWKRMWLMSRECYGKPLITPPFEGKAYSSADRNSMTYLKRLTPFYVVITDEQPCEMN
jgi:hypothetical protein